MIKFKLNKFDFSEVILLILVTSTIFRFDAFFAGANRYIPYRITIICLFLFIVRRFFFTEDRFKASLTSLKALTFLAVAVAVFNLLWFFRFDTLTSFFNSVLSFLYIIGGVALLSALLKEVSFSFVLKVRLIFLFLSCIIFSIETYIRFIHPELGLNENMDSNVVIDRMSAGVQADTFFYFKYGSIMFFDSNYVGLNILPIVILALSNDKYRKLYIIWLSILVAFSLSRSACLGLLMIYTLYFIKWQRKYTPFVFIIIALLLPFAGYEVYDFFKNDSSFLTKIAIFQSLDLITQVSIFDFLFGFGLEKGPFIYSPNDAAYAHALIPLLLGQIGLVGLLIYFLSWVGMILYFGFPMLVAFITLNFCGISLADPWEVIYFFIPLFSSFIYKNTVELR
ncbi:hypothetical protein C9J12_02925 [Photobacterium frigidiphilum]|uniref:Uncharacterized protein n=1 Tax=Photobacterium frigidiphilum TaxID=264736 RepID=A0A2T3JPF1_9GAMM|nr:hypothetical protein [Photobacterium frigidiphilum]PSU50936.1 hypothetical protein C9J12_02925 [Photobacterium frigidiphilum]